MTGFVYVVVASSNGLYKIGYTNQPSRRVSMLKTSTADTLTLLGTIPATVEHERALHHLLAPSRVAREWFRPCAAMQPLLDGLRPYTAPRRKRAPAPTITDPWRARLAAAIKADGRSLRQISTASGMGINYVSEMLRSNKAPTARSIVGLCKALGIAPAFVFEPQQAAA